MVYTIADVVWPALLLEGRILTWWAILAGLIIEYFFVRLITNLPLWKAALADIAMNAISTIPGILLIPLLGIAWEILPGLLMYNAFHIGTFNPGTWIATTLLAALLNTFIERFALRKIFRQPVLGKRNFALLFLGNTLSIAIAFISVFVFPPRP
jgi:hypothetical protein